MFARTVEVGEGLHADTWGAALAEDCMWDLADPDQTHDGGLWAIAHELGHADDFSLYPQIGLIHEGIGQIVECYSSKAKI